MSIKRIGVIFFFFFSCLAAGKDNRRCELAQAQTISDLGELLEVDFYTDLLARLNRRLTAADRELMWDSSRVEASTWQEREEMARMVHQKYGKPLEGTLATGFLPPKVQAIYLRLLKEIGFPDDKLFAIGISTVRVSLADPYNDAELNYDPRSNAMYFWMERTKDLVFGTRREFGSQENLQMRLLHNRYLKIDNTEPVFAHPNPLSDDTPISLREIQNHAEEIQRDCAETIP